MMKTVLYTQRVEVIESYNERRDCADQRIAEFIVNCGFLPIPVPNRSDVIDEYIDTLKPAGIMLTGGNSLVKYGGNAPEKDETDRKLIEIAVRESIPLYGFCRGMQSILDYFGNSLVDVKGHVAVRHPVSGVDGSMTVNSYHNQACKTLENDELIECFKSEDGVIEMVRHRSLPIIGTMWHPEREEPFDEADKKRMIDLFGGGSR